MKLEEAKRLLKDGIVYSVGNERTGMAESCREYAKAIETILQEIEHLQFDIDLARKRIEAELEVLEKYSFNKWENHFAFVQEAVAVKRIRNITNELKDLLKEE